MCLFSGLVEVNQDLVKKGERYPHSFVKYLLRHLNLKDIGPQPHYVLDGAVVL